MEALESSVRSNDSSLACNQPARGNNKAGWMDLGSVYEPPLLPFARFVRLPLSLPHRRLGVECLQAVEQPEQVLHQAQAPRHLARHHRHTTGRLERPRQAGREG